MADLQTGDEESKIRLLDRETREVMEGIERILSAIEEGAPYETCAATSGRCLWQRVQPGRLSKG
jgi:hypothetical protein